MKRLLLLCIGLVGGYVFAQTCIVPAPPAPPRPKILIVTLPDNGGTVGCTVQAPVNAQVLAQSYPISNAKCLQAVNMAKQAAANDNGWNDGGTP